MTAIASTFVDVTTLSAGNWIRYCGDLFMVLSVVPNAGLSGHTVVALPVAAEGEWATGNVACIYANDDAPAELVAVA